MDRSSHLLRLRDEFDIAIIGGGATGLGTAVDAAARGLRVALVEGQDFAKGTSSRSTKLVHGGVRYLAQGKFSLVREALRERGRLRRNAPHLVSDIEFILPTYSWWSGPALGMIFRLYDMLAGPHRLGSSQRIGPSDVMHRVPNLKSEHLRGGISFYDSQFDDARLAITLARTASELGAALVNYAPVVQLRKTGARVTGFVARDTESNREFEVRAKVVINATGVFSDSIRRMDAAGTASILTPSQGVHLVLPAELFPGKSALAVARTDDGRVLFIVPWCGRALLGTTDTPVAEPTYEPRPLEQEIAFLLDHASRYLTRVPRPEDICSVYVGLRPLVRATQQVAGKTGTVSRDHAVFVSPSGLISVVGGKWTTYRKMAEDTVNRAASVAGLDIQPSTTADLRLHGAPSEEDAQDRAHTPLTNEGLRFYGTDAANLRALMEKEPALAQRLHPHLPYLAAEVVWAVREEMARTLEDVLARRTRALILDVRAALTCAPAVARLMARELGKDDAWIAAQLESLRMSGEASMLQALAA